MPGWIGSAEAVEQVLFEQQADRDEEGRFLIYGKGVVCGLDGDLVVPEETEYSVDGERANLASLLAGTSHGTSVTVL